MAETDHLTQIVSTSTARELDLFGLGAQIVHVHGADWQQIREGAASARLELAADFLARAEASIVAASFRDAVSRAYYAAYHALRAATFIAFDGDDHQQHSVLPRKIPDDLDGFERFRVDLNKARLARNRADYDVWPTANADWQRDAQWVVALAQDAVEAVRQYLSQENDERQS